VELDANMSATEITITKARNKTREGWMTAERNLKRAMMDSLGLAIRHIKTSNESIMGKQQPARSGD
jgi:hypothetical protein